MEPKTIAERAAKLGFPADRAHRPQRALRRDAVQRRLHRQGRAADHRRDARPSRARRRSAARAAIDWLVLLAKDEQGYANLCKLVSSAHLDRPLEQEPHVAVRQARGPERRADRADRRRRRRACAAARATGSSARPRPISTGCRQLFPDRLYIEICAAARRHRRGGRERADRSRLCARPAARRDQSRPLMPTRRSTPRTTRCCASPTRLMSKAPTASAPRPMPGSRTARRWPSCSPTCPKRSPTPPSSPSAARSRRPSASRSFRGSATTRTSSFAATRSAGLEARLAGRGRGGPAALSRAARL